MNDKKDNRTYWQITAGAAAVIALLVLTYILLSPLPVLNF